MNQAVNAERFELALENMNYEWSMVQLKRSFNTGMMGNQFLICRNY
ncbi:hypothetical protein SAMN05192538_1765 [Bacillus velezensis]|nr:hypothetical protein BN2127_JRS5_03817 [Bacillus amyloliquefaciens]SDJ51414.1 hypothetical protein SAMN05192538_1765 [Bacillus velezensis]